MLNIVKVKSDWVVIGSGSSGGMDFFDTKAEAVDFVNYMRAKNCSWSEFKLRGNEYAKMVVEDWHHTLAEWDKDENGEDCDLSWKELQTFQEFLTIVTGWEFDEDDFFGNKFHDLVALMKEYGFTPNAISQCLYYYEDEFDMKFER